MKPHSSRVDRLVSKKLNISINNLRPFFASGRVFVDDVVEESRDRIINQFHHVKFDNVVIQERTPYYIMLNKPKGIVSATKDKTHKTVIDFIDHPASKLLHIVGRLDFNSTGLVLLTNDGRWSRRLTSPGSTIKKHYTVTVSKPITNDYIIAFQEGMYFDFEGLTTQAAQLKIIDKYTAEVALTEGRYHQIKRMFGRFQNEVLDLHRFCIGDIYLDQNLAPGRYRELTPDEVN